MDPFSKGIIFSMMPPKKSWQNISNLSRGEKVLFIICSMTYSFANIVFDQDPERPSAACHLHRHTARVMGGVTHGTTHGAGDTRCDSWCRRHGATCGVGNTRHDSWCGQHMAQLMAQAT